MFVGVEGGGGPLHVVVGYFPQHPQQAVLTLYSVVDYLCRRDGCSNRQYHDGREYFNRCCLLCLGLLCLCSSPFSVSKNGGGL